MGVTVLDSREAAQERGAIPAGFAVTSAPRRRGTVVRRALAVADVIALVLAFSVAELTVGARSTHHFDGWVGVLLFFAALPTWVLVAKACGLYDRDEIRADHSTIDDLASLTQLVTTGTWFVFALGTVTHFGVPSPLTFTLFWIAAILLLALCRAAARSLCRRLPGYTQNTVIVGRNPTARLVAEKINRHPEYGLRMIGFVNEIPCDESESDPLTGSPVVGSLGDVAQLAQDLNIERVVIASSFEAQHSALAVIHALKDRHINVDIVPHVHEFVSPSTGVHAVEGLLLIGLPPLTLSRSSRFMKRFVDIVGSSLGLVLFAPLSLVIAVAIKLDSCGPVLFRQTRMGAGERTFAILKFRTMVADADARKEDLAPLNRHRRDDDGPLMFKVPNDPRVTRVGRFLRRFSLDEVPQLVNVLKGEMSLVGPRPLILNEHQQVKEWARQRLELKPGITGLWQVLGRSDIPFTEMTRLDYVYVAGWSLGGDLRILLRTFPAVLRSRDAY